MISVLFIEVRHLCQRDPSQKNLSHIVSGHQNGTLW